MTTCQTLDSNTLTRARHSHVAFKIEIEIRINTLDSIYPRWMLRKSYLLAGKLDEMKLTQPTKPTRED